MFDNNDSVGVVKFVLRKYIIVFQIKNKIKIN